MASIHQSTIRVAEVAAHELETLPPLQDIRHGHEQCTLRGEAMPEPRKQVGGLAQMLKNMTADNAIKLPRFARIEAPEVAKEHRVEILRGQGRLGFGVCHSNDLTTDLLLDLLAQRPRSTPEIQHPPGRLRDPRQNRLVD